MRAAEQRLAGRRASLGTGHAKYLTLRMKFLKKDFETVLIDRFSSKTALLKKLTENGSC
jgi:hypothetical protein